MLVCVCLKLERRLYHAGVDRSLLYITGDACHECISVFKVGVEISLQRGRDRFKRGALKKKKKNSLNSGG